MTNRLSKSRKRTRLIPKLREELKSVTVWLSAISVANEFQLDTWTLPQISKALHYLAKEGFLRLVRKGKPGPACFDDDNGAVFERMGRE